MAPAGTSLGGESRWRCPSPRARRASACRRRANVKVLRHVAREQLRPERPVDARLSPDQCRLKPASREIRAARDSPASPGPMSIGRPVRGNGATNVVPALLERDPLAVRRRRELRRVVAAHVLDLVATGKRRSADRRRRRSAGRDFPLRDVAEDRCACRCRRTPGHCRPRARARARRPRPARRRCRCSSP